MVSGVKAHTKTRWLVWLNNFLEWISTKKTLLKVRWKEVMQLVFSGPDAEKWKEEQKAAQFLICIGQKGRDICRAWCASGKLSEDGMKDRKILLKRFDEYCSPRRNISVRPAKALLRKEPKRKLTDEWLTQLRLIVENCECENIDDMLKDRLLTGTKSKVLRS